MWAVTQAEHRRRVADKLIINVDVSIARSGGDVKLAGARDHGFNRLSRGLGCLYCVRVEALEHPEDVAGAEGEAYVLSAH